MPNRHDLREAIIELGRADSAPDTPNVGDRSLAGSEATLAAGTSWTDRTSPIVRRKDRGDVGGSGPLVVLWFPSWTTSGGAPRQAVGQLRFEVLVPEGPDYEGFEDAILDRIRDFTVTTAKLLPTVEASVSETDRPDVSDLVGAGFRAAAEYRVRMTL